MAHGLNSMPLQTWGVMVLFMGTRTELTRVCALALDRFSLHGTDNQAVQPQQLSLVQATKIEQDMWAMNLLSECDVHRANIVLKDAHWYIREWTPKTVGRMMYKWDFAQDISPSPPSHKHASGPTTSRLCTRTVHFQWQSFAEYIEHSAANTSLLRRRPQFVMSETQAKLPAVAVQLGPFPFSMEDTRQERVVHRASGTCAAGLCMEVGRCAGCAAEQCFVRALAARCKPRGSA